MRGILRLWALHVAVVIVGLAFLAGCTSVQIQKHADGSYTANLNRVWSNVAVEVSTPDGGALRYTSDPETAAGDRMLDAFIGGRLRASE